MHEYSAACMNMAADTVYVRTLGVQLFHPSIRPHGEALERLAAVGMTCTDVSCA